MKGKGETGERRDLGERREGEKERWVKKKMRKG